MPGGINLDVGQPDAILSKIFITDIRGTSPNETDITFSNSPIKIAELMRIRKGRFVVLMKVYWRLSLPLPSSERSPTVLGLACLCDKQQ
jgi:hypothetical protein